MNNFKSRTILLADDDQDDRLLFMDALVAVEPDIILNLAENGQEALDSLLTGILPDIIFLDMNMPIKNGYECLKDIKNDPRLHLIPVIIFSTSFQPETVDIVYKAGADLYVIKPDNFAVLKSTIKHLVTVDWSRDQSILKEQYATLNK